MTLMVWEKYALEADRVRSRLGLSQDSQILGPSQGLRPLHMPSTGASRSMASDMGRRLLLFFTSRT